MSLASRRGARKPLLRQLSSGSNLPALVITGGSSEVIVNGSTFEDHTAGGIVVAHGHLVLTDSVMQRNLAVHGGAMRVRGGPAVQRRCSVARQLANALPLRWRSSHAAHRSRLQYLCHTMPLCRPETTRMQGWTPGERLHH